MSSPTSAPRFRRGALLLYGLTGSPLTDAARRVEMAAMTDAYEHAATLVEQTIRSLGIDPERCRLPTDEGQLRWALRRGSANIVVSITKANGHPAVLRVAGPVVSLPPEPGRHPQLFRRLLEANASELTGVAFGLAGDEVILSAQRELEDLDASEVHALLTRLGNAADTFDDLLADEFGARRAVDEH